MKLEDKLKRADRGCLLTGNGPKELGDLHLTKGPCRRKSITRRRRRWGMWNNVCRKLDERLRR